MPNEIEELRSQIRFLKWCVWSVGIGLMIVYTLLDMKTSVQGLHIRGIYPEPAEEETNIDVDSVLAIPLRIEFKALIFDPDYLVPHHSAS
jgi:hypothetical protein